MNYTIKNEFLTVTIASKGAEMISVVNSDSNEYIWQGDPTYWTGHAYNLFPICGRLTDGKYTYRGKTYEMNLHGFARKSEFTEAENKGDEASFILKSSEATRAIYPFDFVLTIKYRLDGHSVATSISVENTGSDKMYFAVGGHPGFNMPVGGDGVFGDWYLLFDEPAKPEQLVMSDDCFFCGGTTPFPLEGDTKLALRHDLFDNDAVFITHMSRAVTLKSDKSAHFVRLEYPQMNHLGIWHAPRTEAPYVCIEPWISIPADKGVVDDLETKRDMLTLAAGGSYTNTFTITVG